MTGNRPVACTRPHSLDLDGIYTSKERGLSAASGLEFLACAAICKFSPDQLTVQLA